MAMNLTNYARSALINHLLGVADFTMPTTVWLALFTANPTASGSLADEVPDAVGYSRQNLTAVMDSSTGGGAAESNDTLLFGPDTGTDWDTITHVGLMDTDTIGAGNMLMFGPMDVSKNITVGDSLQFLANSISASLT